MKCRTRIEPTQVVKPAFLKTLPKCRNAFTTTITVSGLNVCNNVNIHI